MTNKEEAPLAPGSGNVEMQLDGETVILKPSLSACLGISRLHGSPTLTAQRIQNMDFEVCVQVIAFGLGVTPNKRLMEKVYKTGLIDIRDPLIKFIHVVNNGGRPVSVTEDEEEEDTGNPQVPSL